MVQLVWPLDGMIWSLQILRFIAALMVVYTHAAQIALADTGSPGILPLDLVVMGRSGVDIFFVLSGVARAGSSRGPIRWPQKADVKLVAESRSIRAPTDAAAKVGANASACDDNH
jgi:Acyltransferase family